MPIYKVNGDTYDIPANKQEAFEKKYPDASVSYLNGADEYEIPLSKRDAFVSKFPEATLKTYSIQRQEDDFQGNFMPNIDENPNPPLNAYKTPIQQEQAAQNQPEQNDNVETNFFKGLHQMDKNIWQAGLWHSLRGEIANLFTGSSREEQAALNDIEYLESVGIDPREYLANVEDAEFQKLYGMNREQFDALDKSERKRLAKDAASRQGKLSKDAIKALEKERKQRQSVIDAYQDALAEAGGDLDKAKEILRAKAEDKTWGDEQIEKANAIYAENKELQGAAKWGALLASGIPSAAALGLSFLTKGKTAGISRWLNKAAKLAGHAGMAGMSAGTAGLSMIEARQHGATNWETWTTGIADGLIEFITEKIPFDKLTKPVLTAAKTRTTKALMDAMRRVDSPGRKELEKLLTEANKKLGGKLLNGKNVADWLANAATEGVSEATAEALQTVTSMIYLNPEEYPTFADVANAAWEGAKGGIALGGVLGGAGKAVEHSLNKDRRKQQGFVNVALVEQEGKNPFVAELVDYDPGTNTYKALQDGEIVDVNEDEIQYKHQYTYNEFESGRYRQLEDEAIAGGTVSDAQVAVSADRLGNARQKLESLMTEAGMTDEQKNATFADLEAGDMPGFPADAKALWDAADEYSEAFKRDKDIQSARNVKAENERKAVLHAMTQQMGGEFWQKGSRTMQENGMEIIEPAMVEVGTMQDGKQVFILSTPNDNGEVSAITEDGKKMFVRHTDLQDGTTIMPLQEYLDARVSEQKKVAEQARMAEEAAPQLDVIRQKYQMGASVKLGTKDSPTPGVVVGIKPENDGVFIQTEAGVDPYTYEQLADIEGTPIRVMTDAQMAAAEAAEIEAAESARMSELAETSEQMTDAETVGDNAVQMENMATETPLPLNPDGSVNQDALFKESPARWAEWNDERKQDSGASSAQYISGKLAKAQARLAELQTAYAVEDSLNKKELLEKAVAEQQGIVDELAEVMQKYAPAETAPVQTESVQPVPAAPQQERTTESVLASLNDGTLTDEEIRANIEANLAEAQKAYDKYAKKAPKMGTDKDAYLAEKQKYEQGLPALQQEIDFWNGVKQTYEVAMQQETLPTEESFRPELTEEDMEPHTPQELAARELGLKEGGIKLLWDSVKAHTGFGNGERQKFFGIFRSKDKGGMTIEAAGERLMEIDREYGLGLLDQSDPMAGVNAILDVLGDAQTIGDLRNYIANNREAQVAREAAAAYSAMNAAFEATHGMTMEEWAHANEVQRIEIISKSALTDAEEYERNVKFAEQENQYGTNEQSTGTEGVSGGENQGDAGNVEGGADSLHRQGDSILQEAQSDYTGGETISDGQTSQDVSEGNDQDGDTSVYGSEQTAEVDDIPPAYRGVKRAKEDAEHVVNPLAMTVETRLKIMAETREAIHERVNTWSDKLGIKINIIDNYRDVQNKKAKANIASANPAKGEGTWGWFEKGSGEVFIYVPDFLRWKTDAALQEVDKTVLHEAIAHKGLSEMLGKERFGELCDRVWQEIMNDEQREKFIKYSGVNGNTRAAADEFIAKMAENVKQDTAWDKIANFFKDILKSIGIEIKVKDNDLKGLLKQSYHRYRKGEAKTNPGSNQQAEGNTSFRSANGSLVGMHNISEDKLRKVLKQGGLANPSTAVVNIAEYLLDGYGDISLIMPSSLVDANTGDNIGTYTGDAWTPTYPPISRKVDNKGWKVIKDLIRSVVSEDSPLYHDIINGLENYLEDNRSSKMEFVFLKEKGIEPEIAYKGADGFVGIRNLEAILGVQGLHDGLESYERYKNASPMAKRSFNMWLDAEGNKQAHKELKEQIKKEPKLAEVLRLNEDVSFAAFDSFTYDIFRKEQDAGKIDTYDTMGAAARYVDANNLRGKFEAWLESLMEQAGAKEVFFAGYTRDGERIYKDNTLENVSRYMRLQGRTNAYDDHGLSATKSALLQRLTSLSQIRKNKARLQNESAYNKEYDALKDRLWSIISQLADMQEISSNQFMNVDYAESRLQESFTKKNPIVHLNKEYGYDIDPAGEYAEELNSFIKDVQQMPAKYFETKFERPVYLNEFAAAVMPTTTSEDIKQAVSEAGLPIFEYDSEVEGSRKEATLKATEGEGIRFRTLGEKGAANLDKAEEATIRLDNLGVARQMEEAGKDAKAIKLATGWERGADNLWRYEVADDFDLAELENRLQENLNDGLSKTWGVLYPSDLGDLTKAYPDFNVDIMVWVGDEFENTGEYSPATEGDETTFGRPASIEVKAKTVANIKDVLVHEIQHAIQEKEGFAEGGSVFGLKDKLSAELDKRVARIKELRAEGRDAEADELMRMSKGLAEAVINNDADTYQNYRKLAGEVEARNISARLGMSEQERRESLLSETEDVAREDQIVLMDGLGVSEMGTNMLRTRITPEQDAAYLKAVEAGDMEAAQRMVNEAAKLAGYNSSSDYQGSLAFNGAAPSGYAYYDTKEERIEAWESGEYEDDQTLGDYKDAGIDISNLGWSLTSPVAQRMGNEYTRESIKNLADAVNSDSRKIKVYRAVDADIKEDSVRNGDWVTPSRAYAEYHIGLQDWKEGRIIEQEVDIDDIWWDGNDINEWGYNNGKGYAYKNTPNNRKLLAPVTYDDNGKVIPLSERFNEEKDDIRFRTSNNNQAIFVSNAARAVEGIKMEKATPEQWLKMIEKNGGLKAGEDKWMGLSDWLKASDKKTLTKQEVLDFVNEHMIVIEEQHYSEDENALDGKRQEIQEALQGIFDEYVAESEDMNDDMFMNTHYNYAIQKLADELGYTAFNTPFVNNNAIVELDFYEDDLDTLHELSNKLGLEKYDGTRNINDTRLSYTTEGLTDKHEIALTVPTIESWNEGDEIHFGDAGEGRAIAWIRFGETKKLLGTTEVDGKKKFNWARVLVIDEIQSKRHQEGREKGYKPKDYWPLRTKYLTTKTVYDSFYGDMEGKYGEAFSEASTEEDFRKVMSESDFSQMLRIKEDFDRVSNAYIPYRNSVPDAPFDKNWHELAMKRMLRYAAENGYDVVAWTKGEQQAERYNIGGVISEIKATKYPRGYEVVSFGKNGSVVHNEVFAEESAMAEVYGKEMSQRIIASVDALEPSETATISGDNLRVGGEGMKGFYDRMLPAFMNKYGKKWGVKVEDINFPGLEGGLTMHSVPVTEEMKTSVMEGQTMFRTKHPREFTKQFMQDVVNDFYGSYGTAAPASVVYAKNRRMVEDALGFGREEMPDWLYEKVKEEAKDSGAYLVNMQFQNEDGTVENRRRILIFAKDNLKLSADIDRIIFHENTHGWVLDNPDLLELGKWLSQSDDNTIQKVVGRIKDAYAEDAWAEEMLCDYVGKMLAMGKGQMALDLIPNEYKPLLNYIYEKFGYRPEQEDGRRVAELASDVKTLQMRNTELEGTDSNKTIFRTEITPEVRREMDVISAQAIVNGNYMKAPNGKDSKLTPEQWALVRTKNFLNWFGDWINNPENASKVVDENGEPMVVYHGTAGVIDRFEDQQRSPGFWFTNREDVANGYAESASAEFGEEKNVIPVFLNIRKPRVEDAHAEYPAEFALKSYVENDKGVYEVFDTYEEAEAYREANVPDGWVGAAEVGDQHDLVERAKELGHDGVVMMNMYDQAAYAETGVKGTQTNYVVLDANQIKSATDNTGEFSEDADIRFKTVYGGNRGYVGYSMSKRAAEARSEGRYPKTDFRKEYNVTAPALDLLVYCGIIDGSEWHHTSMYGNKTKFYGWYEDEYADIYSANKKEIDALAREFKKKDEEYRNSAKAHYERMKAGEITPEEEWQLNREAEKAHSQYEREVQDKIDAIFNPVQPDGSGEGTTIFKTTGTPTEQVVKDGLVLSNEDFTNLAGNIFSAMPEDVRRKVVENAARDNYDLKKATLQISASLAEKAELTDEEIELAKMVAQKVEDAVLASGVEMTRPFTTNEALWVLYQSIYPTSEYDLIGNARKAVVADNLGISKSQQEEQEMDADNIRFRSARGVAANSAAAMYNNEQRSAWGMLRETYQDMYRSVKSLMQSIEKATGKVAQSWENILTSLNALSSKNLADKKKYLRDFLTPMWDAALAIRDKYHKSLEQIERYLMIKHGLERNKVLAARDARNFYREQADQEIAAIKADKSLSKAEQKARIQRVEDTYDNHVLDIEAGIDAKFQEFRAKDYGGLTALFSDFADYGTREDYESEELYQEAALAARTPKFATLVETEIEAQKEVDAFEKEVDKALVDNLWKKINAATKETLRHQYANNMLTKEQYERVRDMFEFYVPLRGFVDTTAEDTYSYYVSGQQSKFANPLQGAKGRKTQAETPLGWIGSMAESAIQMDNKNTAKLALYYFAVNRPNNDVLKITPTWYEWTGEVDADGKKIYEPVYPTYNGPQSGPAMQAQMDAFESMMEQQAQAGNAYKGKQRIDLKEAVIRAPKSAPEHVVTVKVAGEDYSIIINANPRAAQAINGMLNVETRKDWFHRATTGLLRYLAAINTSYSPLFWITNFMRDISFAFINTSIRNDAGYTKEFAKNYPKAFRVFLYVHKNRKAALGDSKYEKYYTEFAENGGITGYTSLTNNTEYDQIMKAYANDARLGKFIKGIKSAFQVFQNVGESFEQVSRFAAYITARESGKDISESIYEAKEVTINFNRKGSGRALTMEEAEKFRRKNGKKLTAPERIFFVTLAGMSPFAREFYMFFNAGMQGVRMIAKLVKEHPGKFAAWHGIVFTMGLINAIIHALAEDDDEYLDMPDYVRRTNILIGKNGTYFKWSLPHEFRPSYAMADILVQHAMGRKPNENIVAELAETFGEWLPINPFKDGMNAFVPDFVKIVAEIKDNKDFTGSPIFREYRWLTEEQQKNMPAYEKGFDSTSKVLVDISEMLNDLSGGDQTKAGFININPAVVEHLAQKFGGGPLKLAEQFFKTIGVMAGDQEFSIRNTPFLSTFMVAADDRYRNAHTTELFKYYKGMADDVKRRAGEYKADKDKEGFDKLRASDDFQIFQIYRKYEKRDKFYNEQLKRAKSDSERKDIMSLQDAHRKRMIEEISKL